MILLCNILILLVEIFVLIFFLIFLYEEPTKLKNSFFSRVFKNKETFVDYLFLFLISNIGISFLGMLAIIGCIDNFIVQFLILVFLILTVVVPILIVWHKAKLSIAKENENNKKIQEEVEKQLKEEVEKCLKVEKYIENIKNNKDKIISISNKFEASFRNFLKKCGDTDLDFFSLIYFIFNAKSNKNTTSGKILNYFISLDEIQSPTNESIEKVENQKIIIEVFLNGLRSRIIENKDWEDEETFDTLIYLIIRTNCIKHQHDEYILNFGYETIEEFCANTEKFSSCPDFTFYYIYKTDLTLPIVPTYKKLHEQYYQIRSKYNENKLKQKKENIDTEIFSQSNQGYTYSPILNNSEQPKIESPQKNLIEAIDKMNGREFEEFIADFFRKQGYKTTLTPTSGDYGIDVIIENNFLKIGIQTKCYFNKVSNSAVQEAVTGIKHYGLDKAMVITNNYFQPSAIRLAKDNNVILWDRNKLESEIEKK